MFGQTYNPSGFPLTGANYTSGQSINKVNGIESARAFQTLPNSQVVLFDANEDIFYLKTTDSSNFPIIRTFSFKEIKEDVLNKDKYVTVEEFNKFKEELLDGQQYIRNRRHNSRQSEQYSTDAYDDGRSEEFSKSTTDY